MAQIRICRRVSRIGTGGEVTSPVMTPRETFVIVGSGQAGAVAALSLREEGFDGRIVLLGEEAELPYARIALSKGFLMGRSEKDKLFVHPAGWYEQNAVDLRTRTRVVSIDPAAHRVATDQGEDVGYDKLLLATGARPRRLDVPGASAKGVQYLRTVDDSARLNTRLSPGARVVIVGAGWVGLEVAAAARTLGCQVSILARSGLPLERTLGPTMSQLYADVHRDNGVDLHVGAQVEAITVADGWATGVRLADGEVLAADTIVVGIGAAPNIELASAAGLAVDNGVLVDQHLRTSDPDVFAVGDVANAFHPVLGRHIRMEHWANALNQPRVAARSMLGVEAEYDRLPYFFSDQFDLGMEYSGDIQPSAKTELVIRGDLASKLFIAFWVSQGRVVAGMNVNIWDQIGDIQSLVRSGRVVDTSKLSDVAVPLAQM